MRPVGSAEIDLMQSAVGRAHQAPFNTIRVNGEFQIGGVDVFHDGPGVPSRTVPVGLAFQSITPHFEIRAVGIENPLHFVRRDRNCAVHEFRGVGWSDAVDQRGVEI